jgi:hypothetical protein
LMYSQFAQKVVIAISRVLTSKSRPKQSAALPGMFTQPSPVRVSASQFYHPDILQVASQYDNNSNNNLASTKSFSLCPYRTKLLPYYAQQLS